MAKAYTEKQSRVLSLFRSKLCCYLEKGYEVELNKHFRSLELARTENKMCIQLRIKRGFNSDSVVKVMINHPAINDGTHTFKISQFLLNKVKEKSKIYKYVNK